MICHNCQTEINEGSEFCKHCGYEQKIELKVKPQSDEEKGEKIAIDEHQKQVEITKKHKIFFAEDEILIDTLGSGFISSIVVDNVVSRSVLFCSDRRVYQRGKLFARDHNSKITYYNGEMSVNIEDITGMSYIIDDPISRLIYVAGMFIAGIIGVFVAQDMSGNIQDIIRIVSGAFIGISVAMLLLYTIKKSKWFVIEYAGGEMRTNCNWYKKSSIFRFMKNIANQKDLIAEKRIIKID